MSEVKITISADGAESSVANIKALVAALGGVGTEAKKAKSPVDELFNGLAGKIGIPTTAVGALVDVLGAGIKTFKEWSDAGRDIRPINFAKAADEFKKYDDTVTRFSVAVGGNAESLRAKFKTVGAEVGIMPQKLAETAASMSRLTGVDASAAIKELAVEANDSNRSLEEMAELGGALHNQLGVPIDKIGESLRQVKGVAIEFGTAGGHIALEDTLGRLAPLLAQFQGRAKDFAIELAVLGKGKSKEVAEQTLSTILGSFAQAPPLLFKDLYAKLKKDPKASPYVPDPVTGRIQIAEDAPALLHPYFKGKAWGQTLQFFGGGMSAIEPTRAFLEDYPKLVAEKKRAREEEAATKEEEERKESRRSLLEAAKGRGKEDPFGEFIKRELPPVVGAGIFAGTAAGKRARVEVEKKEIELGIGENRALARDANDAVYEGRRGVQAAVNKARSESFVLGTIATVGEEAAQAAVNKGAPAPQTTGGVPAPLHLSPETIRQLAPVRPNAAAQQVESTRAQRRGAANH